jgi:muramoyltetrapeptide carboxypeptidase LdcA involved in peptidoglycan recycling
MFGGIVVGSIRTKSQHIKTEYFIELKHETVLIEDTEGNIITCPFNDISKALLRDNL